MNDEMRRLDDDRFRQMESHLVGIAEATNKIMNNHLEHIADDLKGLHEKTDKQTEIINNINTKVSVNTNDLEWLKRFFWILAAGLATVLINLFFKQ